MYAIVQAGGRQVKVTPGGFATLDGTAIGFAALADNSRIDMLYVHPAATGQGVGAMLCDALEKLAAAAAAKGSAS